ncbi:MAG: hypothetical protein ACRDM7_23025 [Thermoleophilaceae bacterium]
MTLALVEARRLARSPILWLGVLLVIWGGTFDNSVITPMLEGDDLRAHDAAIWHVCFATLAAGWLALRDRRTGAEALVGVTPADGKATVVPARIAAVVATCFGGFALVFGTALAISAVRGGQGTPDLRLYLDGALLVALGGSIGYALGYLTGSRIVCLLAGPGLPALYTLVTYGSDFSNAPSGGGGRGFVGTSWLLPAGFEPPRSVTLGFLPDIWNGHIVWLLALVLAGCGGVALVGAWRAGARRALAVSIVVVVVAGVLGLSSGVWLNSQPSSVVVLGPDIMREIHDENDYQGLDRLARATRPYPDDGRATTCITRNGFEACLYPEFGEDFAAEVAAAYGREASLLRGLEAVPTRGRMVPSFQWRPGLCSPDEVLYAETLDASDLVINFPLVNCAWSDPHAQKGWRAREAVRIWLASQIEPETLTEMEQSENHSPHDSVTGAARAMAEMPSEDVRAALALVWAELRAGTLPLSDLPGATE